MLIEEVVMRTKFLFIFVLAITLLTSSVASANRPVHQVSGGGKFSYEDGFETYGFVIQVDSEGIVSGQGELHVQGSTLVHFEANCLAVDGNTAWLGGVITRTNNPDLLPVGFDITWQLRDNGEGANAEPDLQSWTMATVALPFFGLGEDCNDQGDLFSFGTFPWYEGNIQVK
jgi:hypothetical protein